MLARKENRKKGKEQNFFVISSEKSTKKHAKRPFFNQYQIPLKKKPQINQRLS
ncbi:hypothetical protein RCS94_04235 [Orbaceae bacterium ac157xtp]